MLEVAIQGARDSFVLDASFSAATPGVTALFGPSGGGKSTLVRALCGLVPGVTGTIRFDGQTWLDSAKGIDVRPEARGIGCVFQEPRLFPHLSVAGNLAYAASRARRRARYVQYDEVIDLAALEPLLPRRVHALSGGERARVALARALLCQPRLLLLDEPLASLDAPRRDEILPYLERLRDRFQVPMVYVSHQYDEVLRLASAIVVIERGMVQASGPIAELSLHPVLRRLVGSDRAGAVIEGPVLSIDPRLDLARVGVGEGALLMPAADLLCGGRARVQIAARDVLLALEAPRGLSVRNQLAGTVTGISPDPPGAVLVDLDVGGQRLSARVTSAAVEALGIATGLELVVLVKAESLRGHAYKG